VVVSQNGVYEVNKDIACGWQLIYDRLKGLNKLEVLTEVLWPAKDWSKNRDGGPREGY
jgi:hypothetical protein